MATIVEQASDIRSGVPRFVLLLAVPTIALALMATFAFRQNVPSPRGPSVAATVLSSHVDENFTLYILDSAQVALDEVKWTHYLGGGGPRSDWYALVTTPDEELELIRAYDHANWIRWAEGLRPIVLVDLRQI